MAHTLGTNLCYADGFGPRYLVDFFFFFFLSLNLLRVSGHNGEGKEPETIRQERQGGLLNIVKLNMTRQVN